MSDELINNAHDSKNILPQNAYVELINLALQWDMGKLKITHWGENDNLVHIWLTILLPNLTIGQWGSWRHTLETTRVGLRKLRKLLKGWLERHLSHIWEITVWCLASTTTHIYAAACYAYGSTERVSNDAKSRQLIVLYLSGLEFVLVHHNLKELGEVVGDLGRECPLEEGKRCTLKGIFDIVFCLPLFF